MTDEKFSWFKLFSGLVNPLNFAKSFVFMVQMALIIMLIMCVTFTGFWLKGKLSKPKPMAGPISISGMTGGCIHNSTDEIKKKWGLINLW